MKAVYAQWPSLTTRTNNARDDDKDENDDDDKDRLRAMTEFDDDALGGNGKVAAASSATQCELILKLFESRSYKSHYDIFKKDHNYL